MPELPEVETTCRGLRPHLTGRRIEALKVRDARLRWPVARDLPGRIAGQRIRRLRRRGKYLILELERGALIVHLGMSGALRIVPADRAPQKHDHLDWLIEGGGVLRFTDPRRFGAVLWSPALDAGMAAQLLAGLGLEPFDPAFTGARLHEGLRGRRVAIKQALLAGDIVVGAGNIYACEALFEAGIDPRTPAGRISRPRCERLAAAVRRILGQALEFGGTTLRDFRDAHGMEGRFQAHARVYGRTGQPCLTCGTPIRRVAFMNRSSFFCPRCQRPPRRR